MKNYLFLLFVFLVMSTDVVSAQTSNSSKPQSHSFITTENLMNKPFYKVKSNGVVYDQMDSLGGLNIISQQFTDENYSIIESADDFVVPDGKIWDIDSIDVWGTFWTYPGPLQTMMVFIYGDSAGVQPGNLIYADSLIIPLTPLTNSSPSFKLHKSVSLLPDRYWISVVASQDGSTAGQWYIGTRQTRGPAAMLRDRNDIFGTGTTNWQVQTQEPDQGLAFRLRGIETTDPSGITPINTNIVNDFYLKQNYPNPFNPSTNINFAIPVSGLVTLKVYDMMGREVSVLIDRQMSRGTYSVDFNAASLSSGIYFYTLKTESFVSTKKMMVVK